MAKTTTSQSYLLQLPGELRNRIYEYAREVQPVGVRVAQLSDSVDTTSKIRAQPLFLGLAQTCRAIRKEFRPIYMEHTVYSTRVLDSYNFVETFAAPHGEAAYGNMLIDFEYGLSMLGTNILPLLRLLQRHPRLTARASHSNRFVRRNLNILLDTRTGGWFDNVPSLVSRITIKKRGPSVAIRWGFKCEATEAQFHLSRNAVRSDYRRWEDTCYNWLREKGFELGGLRVDFNPVRDTNA